jgi:hypothetical protein
VKSHLECEATTGKPMNLLIFRQAQMSGRLAGAGMAKNLRKH